MMPTGDLQREWSAVAAAWDHHIADVDTAKLAATEALVEGVEVREGDRVLELAAGPGSLGATWSALAGPAGAVVLSDIAAAMVEIAGRRNAGLGNVEVRRLDASAIDAADDSFDVVACRMGLMFTPAPAVALAEIHRVLVAGGRLGVLTWAGPEHNPWITCVGMSAMANGIVSGGAPIGPGGIFSLGDPALLAELAKDAGFAEVAVEAIDVEFRSDSIDAHIDRVTSLAGPLATAIASASSDQQAALRRTVADLASPHMTADGVVIPGRALLLTAGA